MKVLIGACLLCLLIASGITYRMMPESKSRVPIISWVTDPNPARTLQIATFKSWLARNNYPECEVRIDAANSDPSKVIIQGVSGVAGDVLDHCGGSRIDLYTAIGLLKDVTEDARTLGFGPEMTYPSMRDEITVNGRQYTFPCNVFVSMFWINKETFEKLGLPVPPRRWTVEAFEAQGKAFVKAANEGRKRREVFFVNGVDGMVIRRSLGLDTYNETLSACVLNDPRYVQALKLVYKWTYEDHIIPSSADRQSFATESGYGGSEFQMFNNGLLGMVGSGRFALIQFRKFGKLSLAVAEPPHVDYPNAIMGTRSSGVYAAGKNVQMATYFLAFLASEDYNMNIVNDADALPPNPKYTTYEEFLRPKGYENEWGCHEAFSDAAMTIAVPESRSPFVLQPVASRHRFFYEDSFMNDRVSAEEAAGMVQVRINEEIRRTITDDPKLRPLYEERVDLQKKIDAYRKEGRKIPASWLFNPFHRKYYRDMGWVEEDDNAT